MTRIAFDARAFDALTRDPVAAQVALARIAADMGIVSDYEQLGFLPRLMAADGSYGSFDRIALDAQPSMVTTANAGIPAYLTMYTDPKLIQVLVSPMKAAQIAGEAKKGDWTTNTAMFPVIESTGETSTYGDFNNNGSVEANANFPQRQTYHFQTFTQWGQKELAVAALAKIDWASQLNIASALILAKFLNQSYFYGVAGLQNYGLLNDPSLPAAILPTAAWSTLTSDQVYADFVRLYAQLQTQTNGLIDANTPMVLALSNTNAVNLNKTNSFNNNTLLLLKTNFPNLRVETAPEYTTTGGELVQLIVSDFEGQETLTAAFTEKMRAHSIVQDTSSWKQKKSSGTYGTVWFRPAMCAQMLG